jgi:hypothetical protein
MSAGGSACGIPLLLSLSRSWRARRDCVDAPRCELREPWSLAVAVQVEQLMRLTESQAWARRLLYFRAVRAISKLVPACVAVKVCAVCRMRRLGGALVTGTSGGR